MAKPEDIENKKPVKAEPQKKPSKKDIEDGVGRIKKDFENKKSNGRAQARVPRSERVVEFFAIETQGNVVRVWTQEDTTLDPDYVIVNPPTSVYVGEGQPEIEDPLAAIATAISEVSK